MSYIETGWGNAVPDPMGAGAYAPGYGAWLEERRTRDWASWSRDRRYGMLLASAETIQRLIGDLDWYIRAPEGWHLARLVEPTRKRLAEAMRRHAELVAGGEPTVDWSADVA